MEIGVSELDLFLGTNKRWTTRGTDALSRQLDALQAQLADAYMERGAAIARSVKFAKTCFIAIAAGIAGIAQFVSWGPDQAPTAAQVVGIGATVVVLFGGIFALLTDKDAGEHLSLAQSAIAQAQAAERRSNKALDVYDDVVRLNALYQAVDVMRSTLEQATSAHAGDDDSVIKSFLKLARRFLIISSGFNTEDQWTICIYKAHKIELTGRYELRCFDHVRAIDCDIGSARVWPEAVGVAGVSFSSDREIIVQDLTDESVRAVYQPSGLTNSTDDERYLSMVAVPINVEGLDRPWGIATATNDTVGHYNHEQDGGIKPEESIRALAGFAALAVAMGRARDRASGSALTRIPSDAPA